MIEGSMGHRGREASVVIYYNDRQGSQWGRATSAHERGSNRGIVLSSLVTLVLMPLLSILMERLRSASGKCCQCRRGQGACAYIGARLLAFPNPLAPHGSFSTASSIVTS